MVVMSYTQQLSQRLYDYVMLVLLELNHIPISFTDEDIVYIGLGMAKGQMNDVQLREFLIDRISDR